MTKQAEANHHKKKKNKRRKQAAMQNIAGGVTGTIFNVVLIIVAVMLVYRFSVTAYRYGVRLFGEPAMSEAPGQEVEVTVTDGMDFDGIAKQLYESGLIRDPSLFVVQEHLSNYAKDGFSAGTYTLSTAMTPEEIMDAMAGSNEEDG